MRYYKIKVEREPLRGGGTHYVYPENFGDKKFFKITYESMGDPGAVEARPNMNYEYVLIEATDDENFGDVPETEEISKTKAKKLKDQWTPEESPEPIA